MLKKALVLLCTSCFLFINVVHSQNFIKRFASAGTFTKVGNTLFFAATDANGIAGLWKSDGTKNGTMLVKAIKMNYSITDYLPLYAFNNKIYFGADDGLNGMELWVSDGTTAGTKMVKDINTAHTGNTGSQPSQFISFNGALYFSASPDGNYNGLWKTDGTAAGTIQISDVNYLGVNNMTVVGNALYFVLGNATLMKTDGTIAGTKSISVDDYYTVELLRNVNNQLVFITAYTLNHNQIRLYTMDPGNDKPVLLQSFNAVTYGSNDIDNITAVGQKIYFSIRTTDANDNAVDALWTSDGTAAGTKSVTSFKWQDHLAYSYMQDFVAFNNKLYFASTSNYSLYTSDGTSGGTVQAANVSLSPGATPVLSNQKIYFNSSDQHLWSFDGANAKKELEQPGNPVNLYDVNGKVYFSVKGSFTNDIWNNAPASQMQVSINYYQNLTNGGTTAFISKIDSIISNKVTVTNTGNKPLVFSEIGISGDSFYVNGHPSQTLQADSMASFNLVYSPIKAGPATAALYIKSNDNSGQYNFTANLTGTAAGIAVNKVIGAANGLDKQLIFQDSIPGFTLSQDTIAENAPVGTSIGSFNVSGATGNYQYQLISGSGDNDNSSFVINNGQLKSATFFNFNNQVTYTIRVKATNGTATLQKNFILLIKNVQANLAGTCSQSFQNLTYSLNDAVYVNSRIVAVGTAGEILNSDDNGTTWKIINSGVADDLNQVKFTSSKIGYIFGASRMLKTENGGDSWFPVSLPVTSYPGLSSFYFPSDTVGYLFGGGGVYKTNDGGRSWATLNTNQYNTINSGWFLDENTGFACGSSGTILTTKDGGATWQAITQTAVGTSTNLANIIFINKTTGYITSSAGDILQTKDGGATWARISTVVTDGYTGRIYFLNDKTGYLLAGYNSAGLYKTIDGGQSWQQESVNGGEAFMGLAYNTTGDKFCLVGHGEGLGTTSQQGSCIILKNGAGTWTSRSDYGNDRYNSGNLFANGTGYVFGGRNLKTIDNGITWNDLNIADDYYNPITKSCFLNADTGFYANYYNVFKTTDAGNTWIRIHSDSTSIVQCLYFYNTKLGFYANGQNLYRTMDGGNTWKDVLNVPSSFGVSSISFSDQQTGYAVGNLSMLYKTIDGGNTWTPINTSNSDYLMTVYTTDGQTVLAGGANGLLIRSTDGGQTWNPVYSSMLFYLYSFQFLDKQHGYALNKNPAGGVNQVYETTDAGLTWNLINQTWTEITTLQLNDGHLFLAGDAGSIIKLNSTSPPPANAGYIIGDTAVVVFNKQTYTVPSVPNTYYKWVVSGPAEVEYNNNSIMVAWKTGGTYTLQATPYNGCASGEPRIINIDVEDMPAPLVTGPDTVLNHANNVAYSTPNNNDSYNWSATGSVGINPTVDKTTVNWGNAGLGTVTVVATNQKLNLQKVSSLNVIIQNAPFTLPDSNFTVSVTSSTCKGSNNGSISIKAQQPLNYTAVVTSPDNTSKNYTFTDSLNVKNLVTGAYNVCIGIAGNGTFQRCYTLTVTEPKDLSVYSVVNQSTGILSLNLSGGDVYYINLNDKVYQTNDTQLSLKLNAGANKLKIYTDKLCQGVVEKTVDLKIITVYPVPFTDKLTIDLGGSNVNTANVQIMDIFGKVVYNQTLVNQAGMLNLDVNNIPTGAYVLKLALGTSSTLFKIEK